MMDEKAKASRKACHHREIQSTRTSFSYNGPDLGVECRLGEATRWNSASLGMLGSGSRWLRGPENCVGYGNGDEIHPNYYADRATDYVDWENDLGGKKLSERVGTYLDPRPSRIQAILTARYCHLDPGTRH